ncbi:MAG TPA: MFS transporter [Oligoflexus sp.]|uniref:MFS transporter n=1 Tax=Oligoflexus sp. TaxID=1971216 RepID=UPI002D41D2FC|nr:MFS transporter [Oligoflexus sp.]HYX32390.1 MFS transporter [Oligoflexus sp.]
MAIARWRECGYAAAEGGLSATETFIRLHFLFYLTNELLLPPALAGLLVSMGILWDGVIDPIAGWLSDRTRSRWGRRTPYLLVGLVLLPLLLASLFLPQLKAMEGLSRNFAVGGLYLLLNTAMTLIGVPHAALGGDLSRDEKSRTRIFAWRYFFTTIGLLTGIAAPGFFLSRHGNSWEAYFHSALALGAFVVLTTLATVISSARVDREMNGESHAAQQHPLVMLRGLWKNRPFLILISAFILATIGQAINSSLALYYYRLYLKLDEKAIEQVLVLFTLIIIASIIGWNLLSRRFEKTKLLAWGVGLMGVSGAIAYPLFPPGDMQGPLAMAVIGGLLLGSVFLLEVMVTDAVDYGAVTTGSADYGSYFGIWKLGTKIARAIAIGLSGFLLHAIGFVSGKEPTTETLKGLALLFGPGVGLFFIGGALLVLYYPLNQRKITQIQRILHRNKTVS